MAPLRAGSAALRNDSRHEFFSNLLEMKTAEAIRQMVGENFADHVFEATRAAAAYSDAVQSCKVRGHTTLVGLPKLPPEVDVLNLVFSG